MKTLAKRIWLRAKEGDHFFAPGADVFPYNAKTGESYLLDEDEYDAIASCRTPALPLVGPSRVDGARVVSPMGFLENYDRHVEYVTVANSEVEVLNARIVELEQKLAKWLEAEARLTYLRGEIEAERISYGEIAELQGLVKFIEPGDMLLQEWAGVPEDQAT